VRGRRLDIQGLRAVAVILVITNHLIGRPSGGFVGVDIFFVISGFLITGLLLREKEKTGRISLRQFYYRRVKRILPAALTVTIVTVVLGYLVFGAIRSSSILADAFWASVFSANWRFIAVGTDYMQANDAISPLQHYWSLAVEEQFYLLWPAVMLLGFRAFRGAPRRTILFGAVVISLASLSWAFWETGSNPTWAYFSTLSRAWELGFGAILACTVPVLEKMPDRFRPWLAWSGLAALGAAVVLIDETTPFPAPWALVPVIASAAIIAAGVGAAPKLLFPLTNRVSVYLGTISYSLYLWHLPVIVFTSTFLGQVGEKYVFLASALILLLSVLSYHFIEEPLRYASWRLRTPRFRIRSSTRGRVAVPVLAGVIVALIFTTYFNRLPAPAQQQDVPATALIDLFPVDHQTRAQTERTLAVSEALTVREWPELTPSIDELGTSSRASEWTEDNCLGMEASGELTPEEHALTCVYGDPDASKSIAVLGDSVAISYVPALREAIGPDWNIHVFTMAQCPFADVSVMLADKSPAPMCDAFRSWSFDQIQELQPDRVVLSAAVSSIGRLASGATGDAAEAEFEQGLGDTFETLADLDVFILDPPPSMISLTECAVLGSLPADCVGSPETAFVNSGLMIRDVAADYPHVSVPPTLGWFCADTGSCPAFVDNVPTLADGAHLSETASESLSDVVGKLLDLR
jgi:peptidoglycan/LPS O-acetylase OafA/YrhL